jgi:hypothetical protein
LVIVLKQSLALGLQTNYTENAKRAVHRACSSALSYMVASTEFLPT